MKIGILFLLIISVLASCRQKDNKIEGIKNSNDIYETEHSVNDLEQQRSANEKKFCSSDLEQQLLANTTCLICHTDLGIDLVTSTRIDLFKRGRTKLLTDIRRLKEVKDKQHAQLLDTLKTDEINCVVDYIMQYKRVQP